MLHANDGAFDDGGENEFTEVSTVVDVDFTFPLPAKTSWRGWQAVLPPDLDQVYVQMVLVDGRELDPFEIGISDVQIRKR